MTDNYRDEMREALELGKSFGQDVLVAHDAAYQGHPATKAERAGIVEDIAKIDAALSRLSARAEPTKDVRELVEALNRLILLQWIKLPDDVGSPCQLPMLDMDKAVALLDAAFQARLSASGQGERSCETCSAPNGAECARRNCSGAPAFDRWEPAAQAAAPAPDKGNAQMAAECGKAIDRINAMDAGRVGAILDGTAPEKGEVKRCAWCDGVFSLTADGYLTCGKCGKQIKPGAYRDPSEIEMHTPADDFYKPVPAPKKGEAKHNAGPCDASPFSSDGNQAPAQPAPSEEDWQTLATAAVNHPEPVKAAEAWRRLHDAALRSRLSEPKE